MSLCTAWTETRGDNLLKYNNHHTMHIHIIHTYNANTDNNNILLSLLRLEPLPYNNKLPSNKLFRVSHLAIYEGHSVFFCPVTFKARNTTLGSLKYVYHFIKQVSLIMYTKLAFFIGHKLCLWYVFECAPHILKYSRSGLTLTLNLPVWKTFLWLRKMIRTHRV